MQQGWLNLAVVPALSLKAFSLALVLDMGPRAELGHHRAQLGNVFHPWLEHYHHVDGSLAILETNSQSYAQVSSGGTVNSSHQSSIIFILED